MFSESSTAANKKPTTKRARNFRSALATATEYGDKVVAEMWECGTAVHAVGLYASLHRHLYAVPALELEQDYGAAVASAKSLGSDEFFKGDFLKVQKYVAWCFARARKWKRQNEKNGEEIVRVTWRTVFQKRKWLVDYRASGLT